MPVKAESLSCRYSGITVLDSIDLCISDGEIALICGRIGSGKSTLLRCLAGLRKPSHGRVFIDGRPAEKMRSSIGLSIQYPERALFERTLYEDIAFTLKNRGKTPDETLALVKKAINDTGLPEQALSQSHNFLSHGQKRLAAFAAVLSGQPKYLFLDEPVAGLDYPGKLRVLQLLQSLSRSGTTIIVASHDYRSFLTICHRLIVLEAGRIVVDSPPGQADLVKAGIASDTLALAKRLRERGWTVPETFSPEALADCIAEVITSESAGHR